MKFYSLLVGVLLLLCTVAAQENLDAKKYETQFIVHSQMQTPTDISEKVAEVIAKLEHLAFVISLQNITVNDLAK